MTQPLPVTGADNGLTERCLRFVEQQSCGEWGDELVEKDAASLVAFVRSEIVSASTPSTGADPEGMREADETLADMIVAERCADWRWDDLEPGVSEHSLAVAAVIAGLEHGRRQRTSAPIPATREGWVYVPVAPTEAMWDAFDSYNGDKYTGYDTWLKAYAAMLAAAPSAPQSDAGNAWQTIDSAPKDHERRLFISAKGRQRIDRFHPTYQKAMANGYWEESPGDRYTHWRPLPAAPTVAQGEGSV